MLELEKYRNLYKVRHHYYKSRTASLRANKSFLIIKNY